MSCSGQYPDIEWFWPLRQQPPCECLRHPSTTQSAHLCAGHYQPRCRGSAPCFPASCGADGEYRRPNLHSDLYGDGRLR